MLFLNLQPQLISQLVEMARWKDSPTQPKIQEVMEHIASNEEFSEKLLNEITNQIIQIGEQGNIMSSNTCWSPF